MEYDDTELRQTPTFFTVASAAAIRVQKVQRHAPDIGEQVLSPAIATLDPPLGSPVDTSWAGGSGSGVENIS